MLQVYRLRFAASAQGAGAEPPRFESFEADELLVVLTEEDGHTIFCRRHDPVAGSNADHI